MNLKNKTMCPSLAQNNVSLKTTPLGRGRSMSRIVCAALAVTLAMMAAPTSGSADTLRVGKAGREAFSFGPAS